MTRTVDTENLTDKIYPDFGHNVAADPRNIEKKYSLGATLLRAPINDCAKYIWKWYSLGILDK